MKHEHDAAAFEIKKFDHSGPIPDLCFFYHDLETGRISTAFFSRSTTSWQICFCHDLMANSLLP